MLLTFWNGAVTLFTEVSKAEVCKVATRSFGVIEQATDIHPGSCLVTRMCCARRGGRGLCVAGWPPGICASWLMHQGTHQLHGYQTGRMCTGLQSLHSQQKRHWICQGLAVPTPTTSYLLLPSYRTCHRTPTQFLRNSYLLSKLLACMWWSREPLLDKLLITLQL